MRPLRQEADAFRLAEAVTRLHPDPFRSVSREAFDLETERAAAAARTGSREDAICGLMRLGALLGERNGHTGIHALGKHGDPLHFYPLRPYEFEDGCFVVSAANPAHVGTEILSINGIPVPVLATQAEELVSRDNDSTIRAGRPIHLVAAEVLAGIGGDHDARRNFLLKPRRGEPFEVALDPIPAARYAAALDANRRLPPRPGVRYLERRNEEAWIQLLSESQVVVIAYNVTGDSTSLASMLASLVRESPRAALVLDLRHNGGGDNTTYEPLLSELVRQAEATDLLVLTSRVTFSAAMQLVVDLEARTDATFVGEATGGSPNQFGDAVPVELPAAGLLAHVATISWETAGAGDHRLTREPDIVVPLRSEDFFEDRDPVLDAALDAVSAQA